MSTGKYVPPSKRAGYVASSSSSAPSPPAAPARTRHEGSTAPHGQARTYSTADPSSSRSEEPHKGSREGYSGLNPSSGFRPRGRGGYGLGRPSKHALSREALIQHFGHPHSGTLNFFGFTNHIGRSLDNLSTHKQHPGRGYLTERPAHLRLKERQRDAQNGDEAASSTGDSAATGPQDAEGSAIRSVTAEGGVAYDVGPVEQSMGKLSINSRTEIEVKADEIPLPPSPPPPPPPHPLSQLVSHIILFQNSQPAWESKKELWIHTSADILIKDFEGAKENYGRPIPVFQALDRRNMFEFVGWWLIDNIEIVPPKSDALIKILDAKQDANSYSRGRTAEQWHRSLSTQWIKLFCVPARPSNPPLYEYLESPLQLKGGTSNEIERYILRIAGMTDALEVLKGTEEERKKGVDEFDRFGQRVYH